MWVLLVYIFTAMVASEGTTPLEECVLPSLEEAGWSQLARLDNLYEEMQKGQNVVRIVWDSWETSRMTTAVAAILLSKFLKVRVELVTPSGATTKGVYGSICMDADVALEVWPGGKESEFDKYVSTNRSDSKPVLIHRRRNIGGRSGLYESCARRLAGGCSPTEQRVDLSQLPWSLQEALETDAGRQHYGSQGPKLMGSDDVRAKCVDGTYDCDDDGVWRPDYCPVSTTRTKAGGGAIRDCPVQIYHITPAYDTGLLERLVSNLTLPVEVVYLGQERYEKLVEEVTITRPRGCLFYG